MRRLAQLAVLPLVLNSAVFAAGDSIQEARLIGSPPDFLKWQGAAVDIDGTRAVVGAPVLGSGAGGSVFVYVQNAGIWTQEQQLVALDGANGNDFGSAVSLDGTTLVVGARFSYSNNDAGAGAVYVFTRTGSTWSQQQKLTAPVPTANTFFGWSVAVDGNTLAIGAPEESEPPLYPGSGATYIYTRSGTTWSFQKRLVPGGNMYGARSGSAVALEGTSLLTGARTWAQQSPFVQQAGAVFEFVGSGSSWSEVDTLQPNDVSMNQTFGISLDLDGNRAVVGAHGDAPAGHVAYGSAYVFVRSGGGWIQEQKLQGAGIDDLDWFGTDVAIDGTNVLVGAINANSSAGAGTGSIRRFERSGTTWTESPDLVGEATSNGDQLGSAVALSGDFAIGGALYGDTPNWGTSGESYVWRLDPPAASAYCTGKTNSLGCVPAVASAGTPSATSASPFLVSCSQAISQKQGLFFYGYAPQAAPFQGGLLCILPPTLRLPTTNSGGNPSGNDCSGVYSYDFNARIQSGIDPSLAPGVAAYGQFWMRDPASPSTTGLSNALRMIMQP